MRNGVGNRQPGWAGLAIVLAAMLLVSCGQTFRADLYRREPIESQPERWLIQAAGFRGQRSEIFYVNDQRVFKLAASSGKQAYQLRFSGPDGTMLFSGEISGGDSLVYLHPTRLPAGEYQLQLEASRKVEQLHVVLEFGD
jgi:hypothetical protein